MMPQRYCSVAFYDYDAPDEGCIICDGTVVYHPRNPEDNPLYGIVSGHLETFLARQRERERPVPLEFPKLNNRLIFQI
jgi:hypothetical protein